ncbi:hypothetical protein BJY04DRAFT_224099, partial [Aspergillus karnatakaensis]|uniref:uncharacterized protein n=1 Tax=Aspergillus karnatakaensis TaxID=1810916 RepID=UPI003CCCC929
MATERLNSILSHLRGNKGVATMYVCLLYHFSSHHHHHHTPKNPDDVVITLSLRTPLTKARKGGFKDTELDYLIYALLKEVIAKSQIDPALVED